MDADALLAAAAVSALVLSAGAMIFTARSSSAAARSATASEASADAARESVEIARAVRHREDAPVFELTPGQPRDNALPVTITVISGPPSITVIAVLNSRSTEVGPSTLVKGSEGQPALRVGPPTMHVGQGEVDSGRALINGDEFVVDAHCVDNPTWVDVEVWLLSTDAQDSTRQWHRKMRVKWPTPSLSLRAPE